MSRERKILFVSAIFMLFYLLFDFIFSLLTHSLIKSNNINNILNISTYILSLVGIVSFLYFTFSKVKLENKRPFIIFFSIIFLICNVISGILGFIVLKSINKKRLRTLPKLTIEYNYKWYVYLIIFSLCMIIMFGLSNLFKNKIHTYISYVCIFIMLVFFFRKDLKRDFKKFKNYFREYNSYVLNTYLKSLVVLIILSLSIKLTTSLQNSTNQETLNELFKTNPIQISLLAVIYAPIAEELMFRGIFRKLINKKWLFIIISGFLFGLAHVIDDFQSMEELLYIFIYGSLGCFLASIYYKTNNLCASIYFHFIQNFISILALIFVTFLN